MIYITMLSLCIFVFLNSFYWSCLSWWPTCLTFYRHLFIYCMRLMKNVYKVWDFDMSLYLACMNNHHWKWTRCIESNVNVDVGGWDVTRMDTVHIMLIPIGDHRAPSTNQNKRNRMAEMNRTNSKEVMNVWNMRSLKSMRISSWQFGQWTVT